MHIFRVENAFGVGMYRCDAATCQMFDMVRHPCPNEDVILSPIWHGLGGKRYSYRFGFASLEQLKCWIYRQEWRDLLDEYCFRIYVYDAKDCHVGDTQAIFIRDKEPEYSLSLLEI